MRIIVSWGVVMLNFYDLKDHWKVLDNRNHTMKEIWPGCSKPDYPNPGLARILISVL